MELYSCLLDDDGDGDDAGGRCAPTVIDIRHADAKNTTATDMNCWAPLFVSSLRSFVCADAHCEAPCKMSTKKKKKKTTNSLTSMSIGLFIKH